MRQSALIIALYVLSPLVLHGAQGDDTSGRLVREFAYDDLWVYEGNVEISDSPGNAWLYCGEGYCAHGAGRVGRDGGFSYEGAFDHGHIGEYGTASDDFWDYVGGFKYGLFHGEGELACVDGRHFKGTFYYGKLLGTDWSVLCGHGAARY